MVTRYSDKILSRLQNIERQIRDMLIFARGETELTEELSVAELIALLREATADIEIPRGCLLHWQVSDQDLRLTCNSDALIGALLNLIENALQASNENQSVVIQVGLLNPEQPDSSSQKLRIAIEDEGSGINRSLLTKLADPFVTTKTQGTGLGLAIVRLVTKSHRGEFQLKPRPFRGVCAEMILPVNSAGRQK